MYKSERRELISFEGKLVWCLNNFGVAIRLEPDSDTRVMQEEVKKKKAHRYTHNSAMDVKLGSYCIDSL